MSTDVSPAELTQKLLATAKQLSGGIEDQLKRSRATLNGIATAATTFKNFAEGCHALHQAGMLDPKYLRHLTDVAERVREEPRR